MHTYIYFSNIFFAITYEDLEYRVHRTDLIFVHIPLKYREFMLTFLYFLGMDPGPKSNKNPSYSRYKILEAFPEETIDFGIRTGSNKFCKF